MKNDASWLLANFCHISTLMKKKKLPNLPAPNDWSWCESFYESVPSEEHVCCVPPDGKPSSSAGDHVERWKDFMSTGNTTLKGGADQSPDPADTSCLYISAVMLANYTSMIRDTNTSTNTAGAPAITDRHAFAGPNGIDENNPECVGSVEGTVNRVLSRAGVATLNNNSAGSTSTLSPMTPQARNSIGQVFPMIVSRTVEVSINGVKSASSHAVFAIGSTIKWLKWSRYTNYYNSSGYHTMVHDSGAILTDINLIYIDPSEGAVRGMDPSGSPDQVWNIYHQDYSENGLSAKAVGVAVPKTPDSASPNEKVTGVSFKWYANRP